MGINYSGNDLNDGNQNKKNSAEECQQLCKNNDACVAFTWVQLNVPEGPLLGNDGACWIKHKKASGTPSQYVVSGNRDCGKLSL